MKLVDLGHRAFPSAGAPQKLKVGRKESPVATITYTPSGTSAPANAYVVVVGIAEKRYRQHIRAMLVDDSRRRAGAIVSNIISEELKVPEGVTASAQWQLWCHMFTLAVSAAQLRSPDANGRIAFVSYANGCRWRWGIIF